MNGEVIASANRTARWPASDNRPARIARLSAAAAAPVLVFFHCFGCGAYRTVIGFVQCREQNDFGMTIARCARRQDTRRRSWHAATTIEGVLEYKQRVLMHFSALACRPWLELTCVSRLVQENCALPYAAPRRERRGDSADSARGRRNYVDEAVGKSSRISSRRQRAAPTASRGPADTGDGGRPASRGAARPGAKPAPYGRRISRLIRKNERPPQAHRNHGAAS